MTSPVRKVRIGILISGRGSNMESLIRACASPDYPAVPAVVISNKAAAPGLEKAANAGIPTAIVSAEYYPNRVDFERKIQKILEQHDVDLVCLAGFMRILGSGFVENWTDRILNIHPSLLPDYPGLDTYQRALNDQKIESGCSVHLVTAEMDGGQVLIQRRVPILNGDTADSLAARILEQEHIAYPEAVRMVAEKLLNSPPA